MATSAVGIAFALVCFAGACAPLGASVVVFMKTGQRQILAASIALAAGVMIFVSLTEVLSEARAEVGLSELSSPITLLITYASFLVGMLACWLLDLFTDILLKFVIRKPSDGMLPVTRQPSGRIRDLALPLPDATCTTDPSHSNKISKPAAGLASPWPTHASHNETLELPPGDMHTAGHLVVEDALVGAAGQLKSDQDVAGLMRTGVLITLALSCHNLPEGLATFVGYMSSPQVGITIAFAIAIHNVPEGIAIGVPMYFATGSRWKAVAWAAVSGIAEPLGALIGFAVHRSGHLNPMAMGIMLAFTAGIMTGIAIRELIPRSMYYDETNVWTVNGIIAGFTIMAVSLVLLELI